AGVVPGVGWVFGPVRGSSVGRAGARWVYVEGLAGWVLLAGGGWSEWDHPVGGGAARGFGAGRFGSSQLVRGRFGCCGDRVGGGVGGVGAAEVAGPGLGEVFGDLDAGGVEVVDDGDGVAAGADAPPGPAGLGGGGGQSGGVQQAVGLVEVVLPAQQVEVLDLGETALSLGAAQAFLDVVAFGGPRGRPGAARHRAHAVAQPEMFE